MSAAGEAGFEVLRFAGEPATAETALVELEGRFPSGRPRRRPRLLIEPTDPGAEPVEAAPVNESGGTEGIWRATFAVPLALLETGSYALAADGVLLDLPRPDVETAGSDADRLVRLAREVNDLRRRLDGARAARSEAEGRAERAESELTAEREERSTAERARDAEAATVAELRAELEAERERIAATEGGLREELQSDRERTDAEIASLREELERARAEGDSREAAAIAERERALDAERLERAREMDAERKRAAQELEDALTAERARAKHLSHELRVARAELEHHHRGGPGRRPPAWDSHARPEREDHPSEPGAEPDAEPAAETAKDDGEDERTATLPIARRRPTQRAEPAGPAVAEPAAAAPAESDDASPTEGVRLLSPRPARHRHDAADEPDDPTPAPGAAAAGARHIEPVAGSQELPVARILAFGALGLAVLIVLLLLLKL